MPPGKKKHGKGRFGKVPYAPSPSSRLKYLCNVGGCPGSFRSDELATNYLKYLVSFESLCLHFFFRCANKVFFAKLKNSTGEACNNQTDAHTLFLFMNGFDFVNPPSYKDNHRVDPNCLPKEKASATLLQGF